MPLKLTNLRGPGIHSTRASSSKSAATGSYRRLTTARLGAGNGGDSRGRVVAVSGLASAPPVATNEGDMILAMAVVAGVAVRASRTCLDRGPDMRTTATPAGPALPVDRAKIVSSEEEEEEAVDAVVAVAANADGAVAAADADAVNGGNAAAPVPAAPAARAFARHRSLLLILVPTARPGGCGMLLLLLLLLLPLWWWQEGAWLLIARRCRKPVRRLSAVDVDDTNANR